MTNEEKARKIAKEYKRHYGFELNSDSSIECYQSAMEAMKWKDEQMKEALNNILIECDACFDEQTTNTLEAIIKHQIEIL